MSERVSVDRISHEIRHSIDAGLRVVFVSGNFNVLHPGHIRLLRYAKECGDCLVVGVQSDRIAGGAAHVPEALRLESVRSNSWVDHTFLLDISAAEAIHMLKPAVVVKGKEHELAQNPEQAAVDSYGGELRFSSGETLFSSVELLQREFFEHSSLGISKPRDFLQRHCISESVLNRHVGQFSSLRICVVGDLIVDEYITCDPLGMSQEDPTLVVTPIDKKMFIGGAGVVAAHAAGLGATVDLISVAPADEAGDFAVSALREAGVNVHLIRDPSRPTTLKQRFRASGKTLLRVSHLRQHSVTPEVQEKILSIAEEISGRLDLLMFSDFNYGVLPTSLVNKIGAMFASSGTRLVADSQSSSQIGDIARFQGMLLITPTEREARLSMGDKDSGLVVLAEHVRKRSRAQHVLLTLGAEGLLIDSGFKAKGKWLTDRLPALNSNPRDVAGAGDSLFTSASMALAVGADIWHAAYLGSLCAALQMGRVGNLPLSQVNVCQELSGSSVKQG